MEKVAFRAFTEVRNKLQEGKQGGDSSGLIRPDLDSFLAFSSFEGVRASG